jgi:hypothetical protein
MKKLKKFERLLTGILVSTVYHPLALMLVAVTLSFLLITMSGISSHPRAFDAVLLSFISIVAAIVVLVMAIKTKWHAWSILSSGLIGTFLAISVLFAQAVLSYKIGDFKARPHVLVFVRSLLIVGGLWVIVGFLQEWWHGNAYTVRDVVEKVKSSFWGLIKKFRRTKHGNEEV